MHTRSIGGLSSDAWTLGTSSEWKSIAKKRQLLTVVVLFLLISPLIVWLAFTCAPAHIASIAYASALILMFVVSRRWRLAAFLLMFMGGPPYLEYELAWVAITGKRLRPEFGLRSEITSVIFSAYDLMLLVGVVIFVCRLVHKRSLPRKVASFLLGMSLLVALGSVSTLGSLLANPGNRMAVLAGYMEVLRPVATVLCALLCWDGEQHNEKTAIGLAVGTVLFLGQSLLVTIVKYGRFVLGHKQLTGLIPGAGATGSFLVLVTPILLGLWLHSTNARQGRRLVIIGLLGSLYILLTLSRAAILGLVTAMVVLAISVLHKRQLSRIGSLVAALGATGAFMLRYQVSDYFANKLRLMLHGSLLDYYNLAARVQIWGTAVALVRENWISGIGPAMWGTVTVGQGHHVHNGYLQYVVELGVPSAAVLATILLSICIRLLQYVKAYSQSTERKNDLGFAVGVFAGICGYLVTQVFENTLTHHRVTGILWWALTYAALLSAANTEERR